MADQQLPTSLLSLWRDERGEIWRTVAVIDQPAVIIEPVNTDHPDWRRETHVLGSPNLVDHFTEFRPVQAILPSSDTDQKESTRD